MSSEILQGLANRLVILRQKLPRHSVREIALKAGVSYQTALNAFRGDFIEKQKVSVPILEHIINIAEQELKDYEARIESLKKKVDGII